MAEPALADAGWWIRPARPADEAAIRAFAAGCSPAGLLGRFHAPVRAFPQSYLQAVLAGEHDVLLARHAGEVIGLLSCAACAPRHRELGVIVADRWQGRGVGRALTERAVAVAARGGAHRLTAAVLAENRHLLALLDARLVRLRAVSESGTLTATYRLA